MSGNNVPVALEEHEGDLIAPDAKEAQRTFGILDALQPGDEVYIGCRKQTLEVQTCDRDAGSPLSGTDHPYRVVWLTGNGTRYRIRYSQQSDAWPHLHTRGDLRWAYEDHPRREARWLPTRDGDSEPVYRIWPAAVNTTDDLADWVISRTIEGPQRSDESETE